MPAAGYRAPWWLPGGHAQTLLPFLIPGALPPYRRERWESPDGDFIDLDWMDGIPNRGASAPALNPPPLVVLFHGLEGSSRSHYARSLMHALAVRGWRGVVPHFRGCSGVPNRLPRAYHSGDSAEIDWIVRRLRPIAGEAPLFVAGVSLGGNALLKWLGERERAAAELVQAAAAVCPPLDLTISGHALSRGFNRLYTEHFLATLKHKALQKLARHPGLFEPERLKQARTLHAFDDIYTGPVHGFTDATDYWLKASSRPWLRGIHCPTLLLCATNDSFVPQAAWPAPGELSADVRFEHPRTGGHVGFPDGRRAGAQGWLPTRILQHFDAVLPVH